jgi:hypothetical protein
LIVLARAARHALADQQITLGSRRISYTLVEERGLTPTSAQARYRQSIGHRSNTIRHMQNTERGWDAIHKGQITAEPWMLDQHTHGPTPAPHLFVDLGKGVGVVWLNDANRKLWRQGRTLGSGPAIQELMEGALIEAGTDQGWKDIWFNPIGRNAIW